MGHIFVTGTSSGIGEATALHLDGLGHHVFAGVRSDEDGAALAARASGRLRPVRCDVTDESSVAEAVAEIERVVGEDGLRGVVSNAGIVRTGPIEHLPLAAWREQFDVNLFGYVAVTQASLPSIRRGGGRIVLVGSLGGRHGFPFMGPYIASKFAVEGLGQSLREELHPWDIPVAVIEPGPIDTPIWAKGRQYLRDLRAELSADAIDHYGERLDAMVDAFDTMERHGAGVADVADAVEHALFADRPKHRYLVGAPAKAVAPALRLLPDRVLAAAMRAGGP